MLRASSWTVRVVAFILLGGYVFRGAHLTPGKHSVVLIAYIVAGVMMALWELLRWRRRESSAPKALDNYSLLALMGVVTASGAAAPIQHAGPLVALAVVATLDAGSDTSLTVGWAIFAAGVLAIEVSALSVGGGIVVVLGYPLLLLLGLLGGHNRRAYRVKAEQSVLMLAQIKQLRAEQRRVAVLDERTRIAREIHDVLAHSLGALGIQIQVARAVLEDHQDTDRAIKALVIAQGIATEGLVETRRAVHALRSDTLPLLEELAQTGMDHEQRHGSAVHMTTRGTPRTLQTEISLALLRIGRESLTNAAKHAPGQPVSLRLEFGNDVVILEVSNPLRDAAPAMSFATVNGGYGLIGMKERLLLLGGSLTAGVTDDHWVVTARIAG
ncbi:sensor histidine kinase [Streptomyces sp. NPDC054919]